SWVGENIFARGIYIPVSKVISFFTGIIPFSLMEVEIVVLPIITILVIIIFLIKIIKKKKNNINIRYFVTLGILNVACLCSCVYFFYTVVCGVNYHRYPFAQIAGLVVEESSEQDLYHLTLSLSEKAGELREALAQQDGTISENGQIKVNKTGWKEVATTANQSFNKMASSYPELGGKYSLAKTVYFSEFMSRMEITGIFWPFTMEANVNIDAPEYSTPATICHELAHQRGFMREDEANFIAYLVCKQSEDLLFQYSGVMLALTYASNQLYKQNIDLYQQLRATYTVDMNTDLREEYYYWAKFEDTVISTVSNTMNDSYLKANSQQDGVKSYGRMVDLLLAEYLLYYLLYT
ncbi:MAG: hypothetical protein K0S61_4712, partial [Anaerocolumna sp.]|nr:hypothetical protein [Anaerocolumna sp.]